MVTLCEPLPAFADVMEIPVSGVLPVIVEDLLNDILELGLRFVQVTVNVAVVAVEATEPFVGVIERLAAGIAGIVISTVLVIVPLPAIACPVAVIVYVIGVEPVFAGNDTCTSWSPLFMLTKLDGVMVTLPLFAVIVIPGFPLMLAQSKFSVVPCESQ